MSKEPLPDVSSDAVRLPTVKCEIANDVWREKVRERSFLHVTQLPNQLSLDSASL